MAREDEWPPHAIVELNELWTAGHTTGEIAKRMGKTKNAVVGKAHRLHLPGRPSPIKRTGRAPRLFTKTVNADTRIGRPPKAISAAPPPPSRRAVAARAGEVSDKDCCWPIGHPGDDDFHTCTSKALVGKPYCGEHCAHAYVGGSGKPAEPAA